MGNIQTQQIGGAGSLFNQMMANNATGPVVGQGCTELLYTDRRAWLVIAANPEGTRCTIERLGSKLQTRFQTRLQYQRLLVRKEGSHPHDYNPTREYFRKENPQTLELVYRNLKANPGWYKEWKQIEWSNKFWDQVTAAGFNYPREYMEAMQPDLIDKVYDKVGDLQLVKGITRLATRHSKFRVHFGNAEEYIDPHF